MPGTLLERLAAGVVLGDGGYLLELEKRGYVRAGPFTPEVVIERPEALAELHREFLGAGAEVLQALTYYASEDKLATVGLSGKVDEINRTAIRVARQVASEGDALVAGNLSNTWAYDLADKASHARTRELLERQVALQLEEGVDFFIGETYTWLGEALIAVECMKASGLPVMVTLAFKNKPATFEGDDAAEAARKLAAAGADVVGLNCLRNPAHTLPLMAEIRAAVSCYTGCQPAAYHTPDDAPDFTAQTGFPTAMDPLQLTRYAMADYALQARDMGINYIGSCCGSVAAHVREMARALGKQSLDERPWRLDYGRPMSAYEFERHGAEAEVS